MGRRGKNEGSLSKRADGRWEGRIHLGYEGGRRRRKVVYGRTRQEVAEKLATVLRDHQRGLPPANDRLTVKQFLSSWLEDTARSKVRASTYESYHDLVHLHLIPEIGHRQLTKLTPLDVQNMMARKIAAGLSPRRVQYVRAVLRTALNQALRWGLVARNVAALVEGPRLDHQEVRPLSVEDARKLLEAARGERLEALVMVALSLGLRQGEALGLRWQDMDLDAGTLQVRVALQRLNKEFRLVPPKTERSRRALTLPASTVASLRAHRARQLEDRLRAGDAWQNEWDLVFTEPTGRPLDASTVTHRFQKFLREAGLPKARFHDLRHTCASLLLAQGVELRTIMDVLGHSQISLTANTYAHIAPQMKDDAATRMEALLSG